MNKHEKFSDPWFKQHQKEFWWNIALGALCFALTGAGMLLCELGIIP